MEKPVSEITKKRPVGRPHKVKNTDIKNNLLNSAVELYAEKGVLGTSIKDIAKRAGVTPAMVYYYFPTKEDLVDAVVEEKITSNIEDVWNFKPEERGNAIKMIESIMSRLIDKTVELPWFMPLWSREFANEGGFLRRPIVEHIPKKSVSVFIDAIRKGQNEGSISKDVLPQALFMSLVGSLMLPLLTADIIGEVHGEEISRDKIVSHIKSVFINGVLAREVV